MRVLIFDVSQTHTGDTFIKRISIMNPKTEKIENNFTDFVSSFFTVTDAIDATCNFIKKLYPNLNLNFKFSKHIKLTTGYKTPISFFYYEITGY